MLRASMWRGREQADQIILDWRRGEREEDSEEEYEDDGGEYYEEDYDR
jgi:hypothetical protein